MVVSPFPITSNWKVSGRVPLDLMDLTFTRARGGACRGKGDVGRTLKRGVMEGFADGLTPALVAAKVWQWLESNGWYVVGALACWYLVLRPSLVDPALRVARAPSGERVRALEDGKRAARLRQEEAARKASETHAERVRDKRLERAEEIVDVGLRRRPGAGRRLGTGSDDEAGPSRPKNNQVKDEDGKDDPFKRLRDRNPLGADNSRGYQAPKRKTNNGG